MFLLLLTGGDAAGQWWDPGRVLGPQRGGGQEIHPPFDEAHGKPHQRCPSSAFCCFPVGRPIVARFALGQLDKTLVVLRSIDAALLQQLPRTRLFSHVPRLLPYLPQHVLVQDFQSVNNVSFLSFHLDRVFLIFTLPHSCLSCTHSSLVAEMKYSSIKEVSYTVHSVSMLIYTGVLFRSNEKIRWHYK